MYVIPSLQVGGGILSGIGGTALLGTCETVVGWGQHRIRTI